MSWVEENSALNTWLEVSVYTSTSIVDIAVVDYAIVDSSAGAWGDESSPAGGAWTESPPL